MTYRNHWTDVRAFQRATLGGRQRPGTILAADGVDGPMTRRAVDALPYLSPHFRADELDNKGRGGPLCHVRRELLIALELTRVVVGKPLTPVSGYRTPEHNRDVGGAADSQHVRGLAVDLPTGWVTVSDALSLGVWSGIGARGKWATHLDVRHHNAGETATPRNPDRWTYR